MTTIKLLIQLFRDWLGGNLILLGFKIMERDTLQHFLNNFIIKYGVKR